MLNSILSIVRNAGSMVLTAHRETMEIREKSNANDLVTSYDIAVQNFLFEELTKLMPDCGFVGEEEQQQQVREWTFVVDPIDGTTNFIRGLNYSNISVALLHNGETAYGVVYNPFADELFYAEKGKGAFLNGREIHVSEKDSGHGLLLCGSTTYDRELTERNFSILTEIYEHCADYRRFGAAALDLCQIAAGRAEMFYECRLRAWDFAAGGFIVEEAGGRLFDFTGNRPSPLCSSSIAAANPACTPLLLKTICGSKQDLLFSEK